MLEFENGFTQIEKSSPKYGDGQQKRRKEVINKLPLRQFFLRLSLSAISLHFNSFLSVVYVATMKTKPTINSYAISLCCIHTATIVLHRITTGQLTNTHIAFRSPSLSTLKLTMRKNNNKQKEHAQLDCCWAIYVCMYCI